MVFKGGMTDFSLHKNCLRSYMLYTQEISLQLQEKFEKSDNPIVQAALKKIGGSQLYYHFRYHQRVVGSFLYLQELPVLTDFFVSSYRVFLKKGVDLEFFQIAYRFFCDTISLYLSQSEMVGITKIYNFLEKNHTNFILYAHKKPHFKNDVFIEELYGVALELDFEQGVVLCEPYCLSIEGFSHFFSKKITHLMELVGYRWEIGEITFAQEHKITSFIESLVEYFGEKFQVSSEEKNYTIIVLNAPNEDHSLALKLLVTTFTKLGHTVLTLDKEISYDDLVKTIEKVEADFVAFSVTLIANIYPLSQLIHTLKKEVELQNTKIVIGGMALKTLKDPLRKIEADLYFETLESFIDYFEV